MRERGTNGFAHGDGRETRRPDMDILMMERVRAPGEVMERETLRAPGWRESRLLVHVVQV